MKEEKVFNAVATFEEGYNCAQSVFVNCAEELNLNESEAFKLTHAFGGGIANQGEVCGAVMGAYLFLSLIHGSDLPNQIVAKENLYAKINAFQEKFIEEYGTLTCADIVKVNMKDNDERIKALQNGVFASVCPKVVAIATEIALDLK